MGGRFKHWPAGKPALLIGMVAGNSRAANSGIGSDHALKARAVDDAGDIVQI